jgi:hypothetical protein
VSWQSLKGQKNKGESREARVWLQPCQAGSI